MSIRKSSLILCLCAAALPATAVAADAPSAAARVADILFLGEYHDNQAHHDVQAAWVSALAPTTLVFEMLTSEQAARITDALLQDPVALGAALEWEASGWPDFDMYYPIFVAARGAVFSGAAVPRDSLRDAMRLSPADAADAGMVQRFELNAPLPAEEQAKRETLQADAHCGALPEEMLPGMVNIQRFRDAMLAERALDAWQTRGGPVVVITGNGHARADWGAAFLVSRAAPDLSVFSLGQGEDGTVPEGRFDQFVDAPSAERGDPCAAFRKDG